MHLSSLFARRGRKRLLLAIFLAGSVFGCFKDPKIDVVQPRKCQTDKSCPGGYVCGSTGFCCASSDGKTCSNPVSTGGAGGRIDGSLSEDAPIGRETGASGGGSTGLEVGTGSGGNGGAAGSGGILDSRGTGGTGDQQDAGLDTPLGGAGGGPGSGGAGGINGSGGVTGFGGNSSLGGATGGNTGLGGVIATGGLRASGGVSGSGGIGAAGTPGSGGAITGGTPGTGGAVTGGTPGTGGAATGGTPGTGGATGTGGTSAVCQGNATQCSGNAVQTCSSGQWGSAVACGTHQTCTGPVGTGKCTCAVDSVCSAIGGTCANTSTLVSCLQDAQGCFYQSSALTCTNGACTGSAGSASCCTNACTAGTTKCLSSTSLQTCSVGSNGCTSYTTSGCSNPQICYRPGTASCLDPTWAQWPMPNSQVDVSAGAPNLQRYTDNGDNTTTDNVTGLMWQRTILANDTYTWDNAVGYCKTLTFAGYSDWHLPSEIELLSIVDLGSASPSISATGFPATPSNIFWSSTSYGVPYFAWGVEFDKGTAQNYLSTNVPNNARCVR